MASVVACHVERESSSTPGRCWCDAWRSLANRCKGERVGVGMGALLSVL